MVLTLLHLNSHSLQFTELLAAGHALQGKPLVVSPITKTLVLAGSPVVANGTDLLRFPPATERPPLTSSAVYNFFIGAPELAYCIPCSLHWKSTHNPYIGSLKGVVY